MTAFFSHQLIKLILLFMLASCFMLLASSSASAQSSTAYETTFAPSAMNDKQSLPIGNQYIPAQSPHTASLAIYNFSHAMSCILIGQSPIAPCLEYRMYQDAQGMVRSVPYLSSTNTSNGLLGMSLSMLGEVIGNPPVNTSLFIADLGKQIGIKSASAQVPGSGSGVLVPIFKLWELSRNIAYLAMILIFVIVGLMVMFRQKLNPQTVVTIQMALPGLVIGLVLITFSYFLASLITDAGFLSINLVGYYFSVAQGNPPQDLLAAMSNHNVISMYSWFTGVLGQDDLSKLVDVIYNNSSGHAKNFMMFMTALIGYQVGAMAGHAVPVIGDIVSIGTGIIGSGAAAVNVGGTLGWGLAWLATAIILYSMIRLIFRLVTNYLSIIFLTITGPFQFMIASLPGRQGMATSWVQNMLCNVLAFPAVVAVLYFVAFLTNENHTPYIITGSIQLIGNETLPLLGNLGPRFINNLLAFGALVALPSIPDVICKAVGKEGPAGQMFGAAITENVRGGQGHSNQWQQTGGHIRAGAQQYQNYRGRPPGWSPATELESEGIIVSGRRFVKPGVIPGLSARRAPPTVTIDPNAGG